VPDPLAPFDAESVRRDWDFAADAYAEAQASGRDYYRYEFFGPQHVALVGAVAGLDLLDIGCGSGYFSREMAKLGARVAAIDLSPRMLRHAKLREAEAPVGIDFQIGDAARLTEIFAAQSFDIVTSCMALQDMPDIPSVIAGIRHVLRLHGRAVVSIVHPCTDMPFREWEKDENGRKKWLSIDRYFERCPIEYPWRGWPYDFKTSGYHATIEDWFAWFLDAGFTLRALREPRPTAEALAARPDLEDAARVPYYLMLDFSVD
jgi:SAM-dependent methyltransferase